MAKSKYESHVAPRLEEIKDWARDGLSEEDIARRLHIAYSTFRVYRDQNSALSAALKNGKEYYDNKVINSLFNNTLGGKVELKVPIKLKKRFYNEIGKLVREEEYVEYATKEEYIKPDTLAQMYWLNNRQREKWAQRPERGSDEPEKKLDLLVKAIEKAAENE